MSELKLEITLEIIEEEEEAEEELGVAEGLFPLKLAQLGFHVHPTNTPTRTAIHKGATNTISSAITSVIVGLWKISSKAEASTIINDTKSRKEKNIYIYIKETVNPRFNPQKDVAFKLSEESRV